VADIMQRAEDSQLTHMCDRESRSHSSRRLAMHLALRGYAAWISGGLRYKLENIGVVVSGGDTIFALTMGL
jgi:hypothetical protein